MSEKTIVGCPECGCRILITASVVSEVKMPKRQSLPQGDTSDLEELLNQITDDTLEGGAAEFVQTTRERFEQYGAKTRMSEKQMAWLRRIAGGEDKGWD